MEVHQLRYFVAVAQLGSFSRAAAKVRVAQPSLSQQIQKLERQLGQPLFDRLPRRVTLTEAGQALLPHAQKVLTELADARRCVEDYTQEPSGEVTLGLIPTMAPYLAAEILARVRERHARVRLRLLEAVTDELVRAVDSGEVDLAVMSDCSGGPGAHLEVCGEESLMLAVPKGHALARKRAVSARQLREEGILVLEESHCLAAQVKRWCVAQKIRVTSDVPLVQLTTVLALVANGQGLSLVPSMMQRGPVNEGCVLIPFREHGPSRRVNILRNVARYQSKASSAVAAVARETIQRVIAG